MTTASFPFYLHSNLCLTPFPLSSPPLIGGEDKGASERKG
jgi:hypothetical protein